MTESLKKVFLAAAVTAAGLLAGCAAVGPTNDPFLRGLTWERYIGGDDLARACAVGQPERFRLVYNAVEKVQRRTYDFPGDAPRAAQIGRAHAPTPLTTAPPHCRPLPAHTQPPP